jgi:hypothetical protein
MNQREIEDTLLFLFFGIFFAVADAALLPFAYSLAVIHPTAVLAGLLVGSITVVAAVLFMLVAMMITGDN